MPAWGPPGVGLGPPPAALGLTKLTDGIAPEEHHTGFEAYSKRVPPETKSRWEVTPRFGASGRRDLCLKQQSPQTSASLGAAAPGGTEDKPRSGDTC